MIEEPAGVREVREWRRQVAEDWEGKSWDEIAELLKERRAQYERDHKIKAHEAPNDPAA